MARVRAGLDLEIEKELGYAYEGAADAGAVVVEFPLVTRKLLFASGGSGCPNATNTTNSTRCGGRATGWRERWTTRDILINAALAVVLVGLVAVHLKVRGFDKPVRDDGIAPECLEAAQRSHGGPQGLHALVLWLGGSVLICWFIFIRGARTRSRTRRAAGA